MVFMVSFAAVLFAGSAWAEIGQIKTLNGEVFIIRNDTRSPGQTG